jgi:TatD DNase family protein
VERIVTIGVGRASSERALELCDAHPEVYAAIGVHPHDAGSFTSADTAWIRALAAHPKVVAVGECGLDYHRDLAPRDAQRRAFSAQIALAGELGLPLVVHTRDAADDTVAALDAEAGGLPVILHCFSLPDRVDAVVERGWMASFAGQVTYGSAGDLRAAAAALPEDRLLVETDSPYLAPVPRRGRPNRPANVAHTLAAIAEVRGVSPEALDAATTANARRVLAV